MSYIYKTKKLKPTISPFKIKILWYKLKKACEILIEHEDVVTRYSQVENGKTILNEMRSTYWLENSRNEITKLINLLGYKVN